MFWGRLTWTKQWYFKVYYVSFFWRKNGMCFSYYDQREVCKYPFLLLLIKILKLSWLCFASRSVIFGCFQAIFARAWKHVLFTCQMVGDFVSQNWTGLGPINWKYNNCDENVLHLYRIHLHSMTYFKTEYGRVHERYHPISHVRINRWTEW